MSLHLLNCFEHFIKKINAGLVRKRYEKKRIKGPGRFDQALGMVTLGIFLRSSSNPIYPCDQRITRKFVIASTIL